MTTAHDLARARAIAGAVPDPELPALTLDDLGVVHVVRIADGAVEVALTPTYTACPATEAIARDVEAALHAAGFARVRVRTVLAPAWGSDRIGAAGLAKLAAHGIAPPRPGPPACPRCGAGDTELLSEFGPTPCQALHRCRTCREPFTRFKCH